MNLVEFTKLISDKDFVMTKEQERMLFLLDTGSPIRLVQIPAWRQKQIALEMYREFMEEAGYRFEGV